MLARLFPRQADNSYGGYKFAIVLLVAAIVTRTTMAYAAIFESHQMLQVDAIPIDTWPPGAVATMLFVAKVLGLDHLLLTIVAIVVLIRWRSLIPFAFLLLLAEQVGRFAIRLANTIPRTSATLPIDPNLVIIAALLIGLALSIAIPRRA